MLLCFSLLEYLLVFFLPRLLVKQRRRDFLQSGSDNVMECPAPLGPFLTLIQLPCSLLPSGAATLLFTTWLSFGAALILSIFSCTWLKLYRCSKITELRKICLPAAPEGLRPPQERLIMDAVTFQAHGGCRAALLRLAADVVHSGPLLFHLSSE